MPRLLRVTVLAAAVAIASAGPATASSEVIVTHQIEPVDFTFFIPCGNNGSGEDVHVAGERLRISTVVIDESGGGHVTLHVIPSGNLTGVGLTTGDTYRVLGREVVSSEATSASTFTATSMSRWILPGSGNNFTVRDIFHMTFDARGAFRSFHGDTTVECG